MSELDKQNIKVLNYNEIEIFSNSSKDNYRFAPSRDGINPTITIMPFYDVQYIASNTRSFMDGWLTFEDDVKEELYKELRIHNWQNIMTNSDIVNILTNPTLEGLQKIIDIDNSACFERVRMQLHKLITDGVDVTTKVKNIIDQRFYELQKRQRNSNIVLTKKDTAVTVNQVKELSEQNAALQSQLDEMKAMMAQLMAMQAAQTTPAPAPAEPVVETKQPARKTTTAKSKK